MHEKYDFNEKERVKRLTQARRQKPFEDLRQKVTKMT